jgi:hypothetical protein
MPMTPLTSLDRTQPDFRPRVDIFFATDLPRFVTEANALEANVDAKNTSAVAAASAANTSKLAAQQAATDAVLGGAAQVALATNQRELAEGYAESANAAAAVAGGATGLDFTGQANKLLVVREDETGIMFSGLPSVETPINISPSSGATGIGPLTTFVGTTFYSLYGKPQNARQVQISMSSDFTSPVWDSGVVAGASVTTTGPSLVGLVPTSTVVYWRVRYRDVDNVWSSWSSPTSFTSKSDYSSYIATPVATPAIGAALEGGFYAGMIWNEVVQSSTSMAIATGSKSFAVADMTSAPLVYFGQSVEVRSRANPANKMIGTVTSALGTALVINVTSVDGSGTLTDWSVMSRYRVIIAPKSSGQNTGLAYFNGAGGDSTAMPTATQTVAEGLKASISVFSTYGGNAPAASFCRQLNIGGYTDWYLPARDEAELLYRNLKPNIANNNGSTKVSSALNYQNLGAYGDQSTGMGYNANSSPIGGVYLTATPAQTSAGAFQVGGAEALNNDSYYWTSTAFSTGQTWRISIGSPSSGGNGEQKPANNSTLSVVRAVRRSII